MKRQKAQEDAQERFPIGAWVKATDMPWYNGLAQDGHGGVRFIPKAGEIVAMGKLGSGMSYQVNFGGFHGFISCEGAACYQCGAENDESHLPGCVDTLLRTMPHTPGFGPD